MVTCLLDSEKKKFSCLYHIWAWRPSWSCDLDHLNTFISPIPLRLHMKFGFNRSSCFSGKEIWKCWIWMTLDQGQWMILTFDIHIGPCTHLVNCIYQLWHQRLQQFLKYPLFYLFPPYKSIRDQIWHCRKTNKGQPRVIIWTNLVYFSTQCYIPSFKVKRLLVPKKKIFECFYHIWAWRPSWSGQSKKVTYIFISN